MFSSYTKNDHKIKARCYHPELRRSKSKAKQTMEEQAAQLKLVHGPVLRVNGFTQNPRRINHETRWNPENLSAHPRQEFQASIYYSLEMWRLPTSQTYPLKMLCNKIRMIFFFSYSVTNTLTQKIQNGVFLKLHVVHHVLKSHPGKQLPCLFIPGLDDSR